MGFIRDEIDARKAQPGEAHFSCTFRLPFIYCLVPAGRGTSLCGRIKDGGGVPWKAIPQGGTLCADCDDILRANEEEAP
jgi:hypothetical protein